MKQLKFIVPILLAFLVIILPSCSVREDVQQKDVEPALSSQNYDFIGQGHNQFLTLMGADANLMQALSNNNKPLAATYAAALPPGCWRLNAYDEIEAILTATQGLEDIGAVADHHLAMGYINSAEKQAIDELNAIAYSSNELPAEQTQQALLDFENSLADRAGITEDGLRGILMGANVMRYSENFWRGVRADGPDNPWFAIESSRAGGETNSLVWFFVDATVALWVGLDPDTWSRGYSYGTTTVTFYSAAASGLVSWI